MVIGKIQPRKPDWLKHGIESFGARAVKLFGQAIKPPMEFRSGGKRFAGQSKTEDALVPGWTEHGSPLPESATQQEKAEKQLWPPIERQACLKSFTRG